MRYIRRARKAGMHIGRPSPAAVLTVLSLSTVPAAVEASPEIWHAHAESVLELLQADTRRALDSATGRTLQPAPPADVPARPARTQDRVELAALYGTAGKFTAVVYVNGVRKEYRPGATLPYAGGGTANEYRLIRIVDTCVLLRKRNARQTRSACFTPALQPDALPLHSDKRVLAAGEAAPLSMPLPGSILP